MQRLARINLENQNSAAIELFAHYDDITSILSRHLPPSVVSMFARPEIKGNIVEWYSELQGQPYLLNHSESDSQIWKETENLIKQRLLSVDKLRVELRNKGSINPEQDALLGRIVEAAQHDSIQIYIVNKQPVITGWGLGKKPTPISPVLPAPKKSRWCFWLLPLLLLLLGGILWWLFWHQEHGEPKPIEPTKNEMVSELDKPNKEQPELVSEKEKNESVPMKDEPKIAQQKEETKLIPENGESTQLTEEKLEPKPELKSQPDKEKIKPAANKIDNSIAEKVKASGGNPDGDFRASLAWHNGEDLDLVLNTLNANVNKCSNGYAVLDVDMNGVGCGSKKKNFTDPVENIVAVNRKKMPNGRYVFSVVQFGAHQVPGGYSCKMLNSGHGFELQIKLNNRIRTYAYSKPIRKCLHKIKMVEIMKKGDNFTVVYVNPNLRLISDVTLPD